MTMTLAEKMAEKRRKLAQQRLENEIRVADNHKCSKCGEIDAEHGETYYGKFYCYACLTEEQERRRSGKGLTTKQKQEIEQIIRAKTDFFVLSDELGIQVEQIVKQILDEKQAEPEFFLTEDEFALVNRTFDYLNKTGFVNPDPKDPTRRISADRYDLWKELMDKLRPFIK